MRTHALTMHAARCPRKRSMHSYCSTGYVPLRGDTSRPGQGQLRGSKAQHSPAMLLRMAQAAAGHLRIFMYSPPPALVSRLRLGDPLRSLGRLSADGDYRMEVELWDRLPIALWTTKASEANFFAVPHALAPWCLRILPKARYPAR